MLIITHKSFESFFEHLDHMQAKQDLIDDRVSICYNPSRDDANWTGFAYDGVVHKIKKEYGDVMLSDYQRQGELL